MTIAIRLADVDGGTEVLAVRAAENEAGWRMALAKLAALIEGRQNSSRTLSPASVG